MNAITQAEARTLAASWTKGNPMSVPHCTTGMVCNAMHDWHLPGHHDFSAVLSVYAGAVRKSGALSDKCRDSVIDQLHELMDEIDQDLVNQQGEA